MAELVDCPSRMARLCEAMWVYAHQSYKEVLPYVFHADDSGISNALICFPARKLVRPAIATGIIAPTEEQRLDYAKHLHVWARPYCHVPPRMRQLVKEWIVSTPFLLPLQYVSDLNDVPGCS